MAQDHSEQIIEIMSDATGEAPNRFHLMHLLKLFFKPCSRTLGFLTRGNVLACADQLLLLVVFIKKPLALTEKPPKGTIPKQDAFFAFKGSATPDTLLDSVPGGLAVFGMNALQIACKGRRKL